jgi:hypothetical protein
MQHQQHIIMKQVIDLAINEQLDARDVQERVSYLFKDRIIPLIEDYLDRLDFPGRTTQIPLVEIDLGVITINQLEKLFEERFDQEIAALIKETVSDNIYNFDIEGAEVVANNETDRVLVACFLETGTYPWWVKEGAPKLFVQTLINVIEQEKQDPIGLLRALFEEPAAIKRLVYNADNKLLREMAAIATANNSDVKKAIDEITLQRIYRAYKKTLTTSVFRQVWWTELFTFTLQSPWNKGRQVPRLIALLLDPSNTLEPREGKSVNEKELLSNYQEQLWVLNKLLPVFAPAVAKKRVSKQDISALEDHFNNIRLWFGIEQVDYKDTAWATFSKENTGSSSSKPDKAPESSEEIAARSMDESKGSVADPKSFIQDQNLDLDEKLKQSEEITARDIQKNKDVVSGPNTFTSKQSLNPNEKLMRSEEADVTDPLSKHHGNDTGNLNQPQITDTGHFDQLQKTDKVHFDDPQKNDPTHLFVNSTFNDIEKLYINNSGLVLLWPFLTRFFNNLGLTVDDKFIDDEAATKACLSLQYLVQGNNIEMFESLLPLNKLLSGIGIFDPVDIQVILTDADRDAADKMLTAVIGNVPLWKTLSVDNLRRAYLQREGILSARDGQWLLQVKRETYDIILDKLPWAVNVIKLPWMEKLIFVEWLST